MVRKVEPLVLHDLLLDQVAHLAQDLALDLLEHVVHVAEVQVERGAVVARAVRDLADGDLLDRLAAVQVPKRPTQVGARELGDLGLLPHGGSLLRVRHCSR